MSNSVKRKGKSTPWTRCEFSIKSKKIMKITGLENSGNRNPKWRQFHEKTWKNMKNLTFSCFFMFFHEIAFIWAYVFHCFRKIWFWWFFLWKLWFFMNFHEKSSFLITFYTVLERCWFWWKFWKKTEKNEKRCEYSGKRKPKWRLWNFGISKELWRKWKKQQ